MLRLWLTRKWLALTALSILFAVICFFLGQWQWGRYEDKLARKHAIEANYDARPVALEGQWAASIPLEKEWTAVTADGEYLTERTLLVRNRPSAEGYGYEVLVPFRSDDRTVLVDRGWVPNAEDAAQVPSVAAPPSGPVTVTGWLHSGEESLGRELPAGQVASINPADAAHQVPGLDAADAYLVLRSEAPAAPTPAQNAVAPRVLERPDVSLGANQAYAIQWWITMPFMGLFVWKNLRRESRNDVDAQGDPGDGATIPATPRAKPKRVRIWDEEDS